MVAVSSTMQALGSPVKSFNLPDVAANKMVSEVDFVSKPLLVMFICNHCPYVIHITKKMTEVANMAKLQGFGVVAISANDARAYPQDGPAAMAEFVKQYGFEFPYLFDESQEVAKAFGAACTPDFFVYDKHHRLQYRGQMDASRPGNSSPVDAKDLKKALNDVLAERPTDTNQVPSVGCNIKWRTGHEPDYF